MKFKKIFLILLILFNFKLNAQQQRIIIASTTSTYDTGLLDQLNKEYTEKYNTEVHVLSYGTGQAIRIAKDGNIELLIVHHKPSEIEFMNNGYGIERYEVMYNDYIIVGPKNDAIQCNSIEQKLHYIYENNKLFISRDDDSGTNKKEIELWDSINLTPLEFKNWYMRIGQGMGKTLLFANEKNAYTISDRSTWISFNKRENLKIICENYPPLFNQYSIILVNPKLNNNLNIDGAKKYIDWITSEKAKKIINSFKKKGEQLFYYNYN